MKLLSHIGIGLYLFPLTSAWSLEPEPLRFNLERGVAELDATLASYQPRQERRLPLFRQGQVHPDLSLVTTVETPEAGTAATRIHDDLIELQFFPKPSGCRMTLTLEARGPEGLDLSDFRNGSLEFKIQGPPRADLTLLFESDGGMYRFGVSAERQLILDGTWQHWKIPLAQLDRMIAPGRDFVRGITHQTITAPFKLSLYAREAQTIQIKDILLHNTPPSDPPQSERVIVDFDHAISAWDGFGVNYVESSRTRDYSKEPEDYSGFSMLQEHQRQEILDLIFGDNGLKPEIVKMFLDPFHEGMTEQGNDNSDPKVLDLERFDHESTTHWMRYFIRNGREISQRSGRDLAILAGLYGPPAWMTQQRFVRGRDLDPAYYEELAEYMVSWVKYLRESLSLPISALSIHNEGDAPHRWDEAGATSGGRSHDHNSFWRPEDVVNMLKILPEFLQINQLEGVRISAGEYSTWGHFLEDRKEHQYAREIHADPVALQNLGILTSHSFWNPTDRGINFIKSARPDLKAWTTSMSWNNGWRSDVSYLDFLRREIYEVKVNAIINWAISYSPNSWIGPYPTHGTGILITHNAYRVEPSYHYYRQLCRAGRKGMQVAWAKSSLPLVRVIAFSGKGTAHPDSLVVYNLSGEATKVRVEIKRSKHHSFDAWSCKPEAYNIPEGLHHTEDGILKLELPAYTSFALYGH